MIIVCYVKAHKSFLSVVGVFAHNELVNEHDELHLFGAQDALELVVGLVVVPLQVLQRRINHKSELTIKCL